jgi:hypothetical protein
MTPLNTLLLVVCELLVPGTKATMQVRSQKVLRALRKLRVTLLLV